MEKTNQDYQIFLSILKEELVPAMGCTEPIALAYGAAKCKEVLGEQVKRVEAQISGNIIKNVKSVIVPNTDGLKGIEASIAAGIVGGKAELVLEVISQITDEEKKAIREFIATTPIQVTPAHSTEQLDIIITCYGENHQASVRIASTHTNIVKIIKDDEVLFEASVNESKETKKTTHETLTVEKIVDFANSVEIEDVKEILERQIEYNLAIAKEGLQGNYGANIGKTLLGVYGDNVQVRAKAYAAAGSDARMSGCEMPVIINSGSGNQGMTASLPVIVYAQEIQASKEQLYRALVVSNLCTIHQKTGIGRLSAYCGAVSAGCGAGCGIAYLLGGDYNMIAHTLVNAVAITSGIVCDGAKPSCASKIAVSVEAGIMGYYMICHGQEFRAGEGLVDHSVEETIQNIGRLGSVGMRETDKEIIQMMCEC